MKYFLIILILITSDIINAVEKTRKITSQDENIANDGKKVFEQFLNCSKIIENKKSEKEFLNCTYPLLSSNLSDSKKKRYSAWLLMKTNPNNIMTCSEKGHRIYKNIAELDLVLCYDLNILGEKNSGYVSFEYQNDELKIKEIKY